MNCETCRFFAPREDVNEWDDSGAAVRYWPSDYPSGDGVIYSEHGTCVRVIHGNKDAYSNRDKSKLYEPAVVTDGSGYAASLRVLPSFGCVLWEEKR